MIRRLLKARKNRPSQSPQRRPVRRRPLAFQSLENRQLLAVLTNGTADGEIFVQVNEQGAFGNSPSLAVNLPNRPQNNDVADAVFNPQGPRVAAGTTYESGLALRILSPTPTTTREFLTAGTIGGTGNNVNGFFLDPSAQTPQNNLERTSRFFWPNNVVRPTNADDTPTNAQLRFDLKQTLVDLQVMGGQDGTALVQEYTIYNVSPVNMSFELIRYLDADIFSNAGTGSTPLLDGGGERIFDVRRGVNGVHQVDVAANNPNNDPTFIEVQSSIDNVPRTERWEVGTAGRILPVKPPGDLLTRIIAGNPLRDDIIPAASDNDDNDSIDVGADDDIAVGLRQEFVNVPANGGFVVFTTTTVFGHPPRGSVVPPPPMLGLVQGTKFLDANSNSVRDPGEPGVPGFVIYADLDQDGRRDGSEPSAVTDANGQYELTVPIGMHEIHEVQQTNWTQSAPLTVFHLVDIQNNGDIITDIDFGNVPDPGEIRGVKFNDDDRSGTQGADEPGMPGVVIYIDADDDGVLDSTEVSTITDVAGNYSFTINEPGDYVVREIIPAGFEQTTPGGDGAHRISIGPGDISTGNDFGNRLLRGSITGLKWNDLNGDGVRTPDEPRVAGVIIYIDENEDGAFNYGERAAITNNAGEYEIGDLLPGEYVVRELDLAGAQITFPASGFHRKIVFAGLPTPFVDFGNRANLDFGDAPDTYGTLLASSGPRHAIVPGFQLGQRIDGEPDGQPTADATGDDSNGGGFAAPVNFAVGDQPRDLLLIDVTGDGIPDLITANRGSDNVSVARGFGDGTFAPAREFDAEANPSGVFAAQIDGVNGLDLVVSHEGDTNLSVLLNNGTGGFATALTFPAGGETSDVVSFDVDADGDNDLIATRPGTNDVVVLRNITNGGMVDFEPVDPLRTFPVQTNPVTLEFGRINGDNLPDLVVVNRGSNTVSVLRNLGGGAFAMAVNYRTGTNPNDVVIADLDGDNDRDLAVANETSGDITVLYNNGLGVFPNTTRATFDVPGSPVSITAGMFDGREGLDLAVALQSMGAVAVLSNDGDGRFPAASTYRTLNGPAVIISANLNGDNVADILTANFGADSVSVLNFEGGDEDGVRFAGAFAPNRVTPITVNASAAGVVVAWIDFNRNGSFDAGEKVLNDVNVVSGDNQFFIQTPAGIADGPTFARFRFSLQGGLAPVGAAASGEVEDYQIIIQAGGAVPNTGHTNVANPEDVDANGRVELFDVLLLVNDLRTNGIRMLPPVVAPPPPPPFLDVNGNGLVELNDVLRVIERILSNQAGLAGGEREGEGENPSDEFESTLDDIASDVSLAWMEQ